MPFKSKEARKEYNRLHYLKRKQSGKEEKSENITLTIQETSNNDHLKDEINELKYRIEMLKEQLREKDMEIEEKDEIIKSQEQDILDQTEIIEQLENEAKRNNKIIKEEPTSNNSYFDLLLREKDKQIEKLEEKNEKLENKIEILQNIVSNSGNSNTIPNTTPKLKPVFNLQKYLNEDCKDALDIVKFVEQKFIPTPEDLVYYEHNNWSSGTELLLTNFIKKFNKTELPIQLVDERRGHYYYKYENKWIDSENDTETIKKFLLNISAKITKMFIKYKLTLSREELSTDRMDELLITLNTDEKDGVRDKTLTYLLKLFKIKKNV